MHANINLQEINVGHCNVLLSDGNMIVEGRGALKRRMYTATGNPPPAPSDVNPKQLVSSYNALLDSQADTQALSVCVFMQTNRLMRPPNITEFLKASDKYVPTGF